jgi:hypothetical protein
MGFLLESPGQLADSQVPYLSTRTGALHIEIEPDLALALFVAPVARCGFRHLAARPERYAVSVASLAVVAVNFAVAGFPFPEPLPSTE